MGQIELKVQEHLLLEVKDMTGVPRHLWDDPEIDAHFTCFKCADCGRYFYIRKVDLETYFQEGIAHHRELKERGSMFFQDKEGQWRMIFTIIS